MALGLTQPLKEVSTRNISWGVKVAGAEGWQPYYLKAPNVLKYWGLRLREPSGPLQACNGIDLSIFTFVVLVLMVVASVLIGIRLPIDSASYPRRTECSETRNKLSLAVSRTNVANHSYAWQRERVSLNLFAAKASTKIILQHYTCKIARVLGSRTLPIIPVFTWVRITTRILLYIQ